MLDALAGRARQQREVEFADVGILHRELMEDAILRLDVEIANPYLPKATLSEMLLVHGSHHISQIQQLAAKDKAAEAKTAAHMKAHILALADALTDALARQFPEKF